MTDSREHDSDRRSFITGALGAAAGIGASALLTRAANAQPPGGESEARRPSPGPGGAPMPPEFRRPAALYKL
jgi:hypothetical protein